MIEQFKQMTWRKYLPVLLPLGLSVVIFIGTGLHHLHEKEQLAAAKSQYQYQQTVNIDADQARQILDARLPVYEQMQARGWIGESRRLQWIETIRRLGELYALPIVEFSLESTRQVSETNSLYFNSELEMYITPMTLDLGLRHEGDFYRFMDALARDGEGLLTVERCELQRDLSASAENRNLTMKARCDLNWYAFKDVTFEWQQASL